MAHADLDVILAVFWLEDLGAHEIDMQVDSEVFLLVTLLGFKGYFIANGTYIDCEY
jgi:hypothetical protein